MTDLRGVVHRRSLADAPLDERLRIREICFDVIRQRCSQAGLGISDTVRVVKQTTHELILSIDGRATPVTLDRFFACFVEVGAPAPAPCTITAEALEPLPPVMDLYPARPTPELR